MIRFLNYIDSLLGSFFVRVQTSTYVDSNSLPLYRIFFGLLMLIYFLPSWSWISKVPPAFYNPRILSFAFLTNDYLPHPLFVISDILVILTTLCILLGIYTRTAFIVLTIFLSILFSYTYGFGKIDHHTSFLPFTCLVLAFTNSGASYALKKDKTIRISTQNRSLGVLGIIIAFGFLTAGLSKLVHWVDFDLNTSGVLFWYYINYFDVPTHTLLMPYFIKTPDYMLELMDYAAALLEVSGFLFLLKGKRWWLLYLTIISFFHLANIIFLNIDFTTTVLTYGVMIIAPFLAFYREKAKSLFASYSNYAYGLIGIIVLTKIVLILDEGNVLNHWRMGVYTKNGINIAIWCFAITSGIFTFRKSKKTKGPQG